MGGGWVVVEFEGGLSFAFLRVSTKDARLTMKGHPQNEPTLLKGCSWLGVLAQGLGLARSHCEGPLRDLAFWTKSCFLGSGIGLFSSPTSLGVRPLLQSVFFGQRLDTLGTPVFSKLGTPLTCGNKQGPAQKEFSAWQSPGDSQADGEGPVGRFRGVGVRGFLGAKLVPLASTCL